VAPVKVAQRACSLYNASARKKPGEDVVPMATAADLYLGNIFSPGSVPQGLTCI
jgi:hypothetical protein